MQNIKVAVDAVIFGYFDKKDLQILLIKRKIEPFKGDWALPGGLVLDDENLDDAVNSVRQIAQSIAFRIQA